MDIGALRVPLTANLVVFLAVCVAFLPHHLGLYPEGMDVWVGDNQWLMWTAAAVSVASAPAVPLLGQQGERR